jgi:putative membrane protein
MNGSRKKIAMLAGVTFAFGLTASAASFADTPALSKSDQAFVAKVLQGGMFEVAASKVAEDKASAQDVKDQANTEVHDHELVGSKLKSIASSNGDDFSTDLNADFTARVAKLNALSGKAFDDAYIAEMKTIHALDGAAFAQEAKTGQNADLKAFAAETVLIVKRHIGALHGVSSKS